MEDFTLNENDKKLLAYCHDKSRSVNDIARYLSISPASVSAKIDKLKRLNKIIIEQGGQGKKTYVRAKEGSKLNEYIIELLQEIDKRETISFEEYSSLLNKYENVEDTLDASFKLLHMHPKMVRQMLVITEEGKRLLKESKSTKTKK